MGIISRLRYYMIKLFSSELYFYKEDMLVYLTPKTTNIYFNSCDEKLKRNIKKYCHEDKLFIDVGACIGAIGIPASKYYRQIHCFEPIPANKSILDANITANNCSNVVSHSYSLGEDNKTVFFDDNYGNSKRLINDGGFKVLQRTGDSFNFTDVGFIKIDVEGFEFEVLKGFTETIKRDKPVIVLESNSGNNDKVHPLMKLLGYTLKEHYKENELWVNKND